MSRRSIPTLLADLKSTIAELELELGHKGSITPPVTGKRPSTDYSGPTGGMRMLIDQGFFKEPKSLSLVLSELRKEGYNYRKEVVSTTLVRLVRQRMFTRVPSPSGDAREKWNYAERK